MASRSEPSFTAAEVRAIALDVANEALSEAREHVEDIDLGYGCANGVDKVEVEPIIDRVMAARMQKPAG